ncbi:oleate hydratase [Kipferlia bialata]|uniref:Oleate hydratase n=1 Tax=Kipferlia bialata TaxID=797122 RepID=A0A9K3CRB6_9EUKA|nr:oleate hydratase [Kipferlia bialata]|eukprot:g1930.t1
MTTGDNTRQAYFVGGGLASLAGAAYLIRDCGFPGANIHILEGMHILGGSNDGIGTPEGGFVCRGGRMLNEETYENFWELFRSIPSLADPEVSVTDEIFEFDHAHPTCAKARLINKDQSLMDVSTMGFNQKDRNRMLKLMVTKETKLDDLTIQDWFGADSHFFTTQFWYMWQTTFAFQKWSSLFEFRRYMNRMMFEYSRIETLEGVTRTKLNQYDSVILPLKAYLDQHGVDFSVKCRVTDLDFAEGDGITVTGIHMVRADAEEEETITLNAGDICIATNGCMTDNASLGDMHTPAPMQVGAPMSGEFWARIAAKKEGLGNPAPFFSNPEETNWESFTVTCRGSALLERIEAFSGNVPGSGALMTFKDSKWLMSIVVAGQPHFANQTEDETIFWGYALNTDVEGDFVHKAMRDCTGEEMLTELMGQLGWTDDLDAIKADVINVIPCMMPYIISMFQPRKMADRPQVVPAGSTNFGMVSQFVELKDDMVFTEEFSVRAARTAVYTLMGVTDHTICPVTPHSKTFKTKLNAVKTSYR